LQFTTANRRRRKPSKRFSFTTANPTRKPIWHLLLGMRGWR
jgi:hypothetical protein